MKAQFNMTIQGYVELPENAEIGTFRDRINDSIDMIGANGVHFTSIGLGLNIEQPSQYSGQNQLFDTPQQRGTPDNPMVLELRFNAQEIPVHPTEPLPADAAPPPPIYPDKPTIPEAQSDQSPKE